MYIYHFSRYAGTDRVFSFPGECPRQAGDLIQYDDGAYVLVLGEDIARKEQVRYSMNDAASGTRVRKSLLSPTTCELLHSFVHTRYTTYKQSIPLRLADIDDIMKRAPSATQRKNISFAPHPQRTIQDDRLSLGSGTISGQQLIIFPDIRTMTQMLDGQLDKDATGVVVLHGRSTKKQKSDAFWGVKAGKIHTIFCTYSQMFQDRVDLAHVVLIDQHTRWYKAQRDPRYVVPRVVEQLMEQYGSSCEQSGYDLVGDVQADMMLGDEDG